LQLYDLWLAVWHVSCLFAPWQQTLACEILKTRSVRATAINVANMCLKLVDFAVWLGKVLKSTIEDIKAAGTFKKERVITSPQSADIVVNVGGRRVCVSG
jgi:hypothetical protein